MDMKLFTIAFRIEILRFYYSKDRKHGIVYDFWRLLRHAYYLKVDSGNVDAHENVR